MMPPKSDKKKERRVVLRSDDEWIARIDDWRGKRRPIVSLSEAIRLLVEKALERDE